MAAFWEDLKRTVQQGLSVAAEKTEEYTKIGKIKMDILSIKKEIDKTHRELGQRVSALIDEKKADSIGSDAKVKELKEHLNLLKKNLVAKDAEIEEIKKQNPDIEDADIDETEVDESVAEEAPARKTRSTRSRRSKKTE